MDPMMMKAKKARITAVKAKVGVSNILRLSIVHLEERYQD
jgi:hypothetical protein